MTDGSGDLAVGIDLGGTHVRAAVVDTAGGIRAQARDRVDADRSPASVVERLVGVVHLALQSAGLQIDRLAGVGVGVAGQLRGDSGVVARGPNLGWREVPLGEMLTGRLGRPVRVVNDVDAIAWGEVCHGAARGLRDVLVVFCGTGVGGGLVLAGRPYHGASGAAGEIGHVKVRPEDGAACGCGQRGCLEAYLGGKNLSERLHAEALGDWPRLLELTGGDPAAIHPGLVERLFEQGDPRAAILWQELALMFGDVLANAVSLLNLSAVVLGGTVLTGCPGLHRLARERLALRVPTVAGEVLQILADQLGDRAGMIGAAALVLRERRGSLPCGA